MLDYKGKSIAIIGMARTGMAVAEVMNGLGARVVLYDRKSESELAEQLEAAHRLGVEARAGTDKIDLSDVDLVGPSPGVPRGLSVFAEAESRGIEVISEIELAYRLSKAPVIAVTGTNGKTTTTVLIGRMMMADGRDTYIAGNVVAGDIRLPLVTAAYKASPESVIVAEISTFQLEWIRSFRPKIAALLNVTSDHMDRHSSVEEYAGSRPESLRIRRPMIFRSSTRKIRSQRRLVQLSVAASCASPASRRSKKAALCAGTILWSGCPALRP